MTSESGNRFDMSAEMRAFAEKGLDQAKAAFDAFASAAQQAATVAQTQAMTAQSGARELTQLAMRYAERNVASSFEFAQKLMHAKDAAEVAALHSEYVNSQMGVLTEQAREMSRQASKMGGTGSTH
jgi:phasin